MARKIIILSDGTGNAASSVWRTNVWRIFQSLKLESHDQVAHYDDGVGTSSFKPLAVLGGAFGYGLKRNVLAAYKFICRNYQPDSQLYLFGFSRGAFTVRVLSALILQQGLVQASSDAELHDLARKAYRAYRAKGYNSRLRLERVGRSIRDVFFRAIDKVLGRQAYHSDNNLLPSSIEFIGVWDTVAAYGLPADEMTRGISDWIWPLELPNRILSPKVLCARHALALDDERTTFHPVLWTEAGEHPAPVDEPYPIANRRLAQVWFTGMHANVGGGYPDDSLAFTPLYWLMREAKNRGLVFKQESEADPDTEKWMKAGRDPDGRLYDSRSGLGGYYRYGPRKVEDLCNDTRTGVEVDRPKIHESVFDRIDLGCNSYAPIGLPKEYVVVKDDGTVLPLYPKLPAGEAQYETQHQAEARAQAQERLWNYVWMRRVVYFLTLAATFNLVLFWMIYDKNPAREYESQIRMVSETLRLLEMSILPVWAKFWVDHFAANPVTFVVSVVVLIGLIATGSFLSGKINDSMRAIWRARDDVPQVAAGRAHRALLWFRTSRGYRNLIAFFKYWLLPMLFAAAVIIVAVTGASHLAFNAFDSTSAYCMPSETRTRVNLGIQQKGTDFQTSQLCAPTGLEVRQGYRYEIVIDVTEPWRDSEPWRQSYIDTTPEGFLSGSQPVVREWTMRLGILTRRILWRRWFMVVARVGDKGVDEYFLDPVRVRDSRSAWRSEFVANRSGEVFLYVNDAVIGLPWFADVFYRGNVGKAAISIRLCDSTTCRRS